MKNLTEIKFENGNSLLLPEGVNNNKAFTPNKIALKCSIELESKVIFLSDITELKELIILNSGVVFEQL